MNTIKFQPVPNLTPAKLVRVAREYAEGFVSYSSRGSWIDRSSGYVCGKVDCVRLLLYIAQDVGLLPAVLDINVPRPHDPGAKPLGRDEFMLQLLEENCDRKWCLNGVFPPATETVREGDILLFQWPDSRYHVAIKTDMDPLPYGRMIEARDGEGVVEATIMADDWGQLVSAWGIRGVQ